MLVRSIQGTLQRGSRGLLLAGILVGSSVAELAHQAAAGDAVAIAAEPTAKDLAFFEAKIRPVLLEHCVECHAGDQEAPGGGLALDRALGWQLGGDSGPAILPGDAEGSLLMSALRYESLEMPPDGRLPPQVIRDFQTWIDSGAPDPRDADAPLAPQRGEIDWAAAQSFWAFQPPRHTPPQLSGDAPGADPVDQYLLAQLQAAGLSWAPPADPLVLLRRLSFDLRGLPPSPEQIAAFRADPSPEHWQRLVDQWLHSPQYAEHWGRHWLDVARYADSNGSDFNATFHDAWRYRDFVIRSFADDKPFDHFVVQQIAGDLLDTQAPEEIAENLVATGFLMLGTKMLSERDKEKLELDVVDDMIDSVGRTFLGLTLGCARCHDHKFDPIPTADYYALAGIFRSTQVLDGESQRYVSTWHKRPLPLAPEHARALEHYETTKQRLTSELAAAKKRLETAKASLPNPSGVVVIDDSQAQLEGPWHSTTYSSPYFGAGYVHDQNRNKGQSKARFAGPPQAGTYEVRLSYTSGSNRASNVPVQFKLANGERHALTLDQRQKPAIEGLWHSLGKHTFAAAEPAALLISNRGTDGFVMVDAVQYVPEADPARAVPEPSDQQIAQVAAAEQAVKSAEAALQELETHRPPPPPQAMAVREAAQVGDTHICVRGEVANRGPVVPRGFLRLWENGRAAEIPTDQSGRLQLARWVADPQNPLTARVIVNRVWMHLFGEGLVRTVDNFGLQGEAPSHPELLDHLTLEFIRDQWSIRRLIRRLVMTDAYRRSSRFDESAYQHDPENRLLWRASRRRLSAEAMRDTLLLAGGQLDSTASHAPMAGFGTLVTQNVAAPAEVKLQSTPRRSVYLPVIRGNLPTFFATFDFADPDLIVGRRERTNVPAQGLTMLNNPEVAQWCEQIAQRLIDQHQVPSERLTAMYHRLLQRDPQTHEQQLFLNFINTVADETRGWTQAVQTLAASTEFRFLD